MICDRCGTKYAKKSGEHRCPRPSTYKRGREGIATPAEMAALAGPRQLDLFEHFVDSGRHAQAAVDAILGKRRRHG